VSVVNSVVGAGGVAILLGVTLDLPLSVAAVAGVAFLAVSVSVHMRYDRRSHIRASAAVEALFPLPQSGSASVADPSRRRAAPCAMSGRLPLASPDAL
jgi:hypothetical protein